MLLIELVRNNFLGWEINDLDFKKSETSQINKLFIHLKNCP